MTDLTKEKRHIPALPRLTPEAFQQCKRDNIRIYGYNNRLMNQLQPLIQNSKIAYALFSPDGCLLKLTASETVLAQLKSDNITPGTIWSLESAGYNAVSFGLSQAIESYVTFSTGEDNVCAPLKRYAIYFVSLAVRDNSTDYKCPTHIYGGVALIMPAQAYDPDYNMMAFSVANDIILHVDIGNTYARVLSRGVDAFLMFDISAKSGKIHTLYYSKNLFDIFGIEPQDIAFHLAEELIDPLPRNREFWEIISKHLVLREAPLSLIVQGKKIDCIVSTDPYYQPNLNVSGVTFLITTRKIRTANISRQIGNNAVLTFSDIIGESRTILTSIQKAKQIANSDSNVLITGESGTGKDVFAQAIHNAGSRRNKPFVAVNCGALPRDLISSELFGYESGAFTGANRNGNMGKFELADGGTLFLDEIGELPFDLQASLLRAVEQKKITRVGGRKDIPVDVRIISATNVNIKGMIEQRLFRSDLYYRLSTLRLHLAPLREREQDVILLSEHFIRVIAEKIGRSDNIMLSDQAKTLLTTLPWTGNIRELQNVFEGIIQLSNNSVIDAEQIIQELGLSTADAASVEAGPPTAAAVVPSRRGMLTEADIRHALEICGGNRSAAAKYLGIGRRTLYNNMERLKMTAD